MQARSGKPLRVREHLALTFVARLAMDLVIRVSSRTERLSTKSPHERRSSITTTVLKFLLRKRRRQRRTMTRRHRRDSSAQIYAAARYSHILSRWKTERGGRPFRHTRRTLGQYPHLQIVLKVFAWQKRSSFRHFVQARCPRIIGAQAMFRRLRLSHLLWLCRGIVSPAALICLQPCCPSSPRAQSKRQRTSAEFTPKYRRLRVQQLGKNQRTSMELTTEYRRLRVQQSSGASRRCLFKWTFPSSLSSFRTRAQRQRMIHRRQLTSTSPSDLSACQLRFQQ